MLCFKVAQEQSRRAVMPSKDGKTLCGIDQGYLWVNLSLMVFACPVRAGMVLSINNVIIRT